MCFFPYGLFFHVFLLEGILLPKVRKHMEAEALELSTEIWPGVWVYSGAWSRTPDGLSPRKKCVGKNAWKEVRGSIRKMDYSEVVVDFEFHVREFGALKDFGQECDIIQILIQKKLHSDIR